MAKTGAPARRIVVLLIVTALALMTMDARGSRAIGRARETAASVTSPLRDAVAWAGSPIADTWNGAVHYDDVQRENDELRRRITELEGEISRQPDVESDLRALQEATDLAYIGDIPRVTARVVADQRTGLERIVEINKGSDDGVLPGMAVVVGDGLAGTVIAVPGPDLATVRLITDPRQPVGAISVRNGEIVVATGDGDGRPLLVDRPLSEAGELAIGDRFETTGFRQFPADIPVGELAEGDEGELVMEPFVNFDGLTYVTILLVEPVE